MSTAVIISGQMRTFARCYPTQRWQVFRHYEPDIHFFVSCCSDSNSDSAELLRQNYANVHIEKWTDPTDLPEIPIELGAHAPYANAASHRQLMLQHWGNKRAWEFFERSRKAGRQEFQTVIRMRPDNFFHRFVPPQIAVADLSSCFAAGTQVRQPIMDHDCFAPWWGKFGGINDRFAVMGIRAAEAYFLTYDRIPELLKRGCPFHPESLVAASLQMSRIQPQTCLSHFSTLRTTGDQRWPEIAAEDLAELIANR